MKSVSVIIPCFNEEKTIQLVLQSIYQQDFNRSDVEVIIADGNSSDNTVQKIQIFQAEHPDLEIHVVENLERNIPAGLNTAIKHAQGTYIIRLDAHCMPQSDYIRLCIEDLKAKLGENVGGVWEILPGKDGWMARAISLAASHPLGVGDARYRYSTKSGEVDTVPFGAFHRDIFDKIGLFNEALKTNEDYEYNARLRQKGGRVWLDARIRSIYFARSSLGELSQQYWRYGYWKWRMLKDYPKTLRWRQALPPLFVLSLAGLLIISCVWHPAIWILVFEFLAYVFILLASSVWSAVKKRDILLAPGLMLAIATMHFSWGTGFLWSMVKR